MKQNPLLIADPAEGGDTALLEKIERGVGSLDTELKTVKSGQQKILEDQDRWSKELKTTIEDITKLKKVANDTDAGFKEMTRKIATFDALARREARSAFGNPIQRIIADEELRTKFNAVVRNATKSPLSEAHKKALGEDTSPGSTVIDDRLATEIFDTLATFGVWNTFAVRPLSTKQTKFPVKTARPVANFILTEGSAITDDATKAGTSVTLEVEVIAALLKVSRQLLEDAEIDVTADVLGDFAEAYANRLDHACLNAAGAANATDGGMTGIFQGGTAATADAGAGADDTVEELELEDFTRCLTTVDPIVLNRMAKWWMHPQILVRMLSVKDLNGRPIFLTALEAPAHGSIGSILGYPVVPAFAAPTTNAAGAKVAVFGDPEGLVVGVRRDFAFEASDEFSWNTLERTFRGWGRAGTKIRRALSFAVLTLGA